MIGWWKRRRERLEASRREVDELAARISALPDREFWRVTMGGKL